MLGDLPIPGGALFGSRFLWFVVSFFKAHPIPYALFMISQHPDIEVSHKLLKNFEVNCGGQISKSMSCIDGTFVLHAHDLNLQI